MTIRSPPDPVPVILDALERIEEQISSTETSVNDPESGLAAIRKGVTETTVAVGEVAADLKLSIETQIQILRDRINALRDEIVRLGGPGAAAHRVWLSPYWTDLATGGGGGGLTVSAHLLHVARVRVTTPAAFPPAWAACSSMPEVHCS